MAQPTVTARPATWTGTNMPILYKLTSTNYAQAGYRFVVEVWNAGTAAKIADAVYYPNSAGALVVDISSFLKANINLGINYALTTEALLEDTSYIKYYIKYQEVWNAGSETQVNDNSNPRWAVYGGIQIPASANSLSDYVITDSSTTSKFLTKLDTPVMWRGWPFALNILSNNNSDTINIIANSTSEGDETIGALGDERMSAVVMTGGDYDNVIDKEFTLRAYNATDTAAAGETKTVKLRTPCSNPVMLFTRNSLGGTLQWLFDISQEYTFVYEDNRKAKRLTLITDGLTINEWESLQDFIGLGEVYRENIIEVTSSTIKTKSRIGQQVYAVTATGTKLGVIVIPSSNTTETRRVKHQFTLEIEYPQVL